MKKLITITESANGYISEILDKNPNTSFVVGYDNSGCGGHKYTFALCYNDDIPDDVDSVNVNSGRVVIVPQCVEGLSDAILDLHETAFDKQLVWTNPMALGSCGCGQSFNLDGDAGCN